MPKPTITEALSLYSLPAVQGGWGAAEVVSDVDRPEPDFSNLDVVQNANTNILYNDFAKNMHYTTCRKAFPPSDVANEIWRILLQPQWVRPGYAPK